MNIAIIPARGGSKRIPRKNIKEFCGKPMIAWSIEAALESGCFDLVIVSTDDPEIAELARLHGASTPFMRPVELSDDLTGTVPVIKHAVDWLLEHKLTPSKVCCIYATAPFIRPADLRTGMELLESTKSSYVFTATSFVFPIQRAIRITEQQGCEPIFPESIGQRSQDLEEAYHDAGQFYWAMAETWLRKEKVFSPKSRPLLLPRYLVQDIDTSEDWQRAELMFKSMPLDEAH